jgi:adenylylsulfate kinase-like enzyme
MNIYAQEFKVSQIEREKIKGQKSMTIWMSGLSGSGKSTIANQLENSLNLM